MRQLETLGGGSSIIIIIIIIITRKCAVDYDTTALSAIRDVGSLW